MEEVAASIGETGDRGAVPEEMRSLMLRGAALVVWAGMEILPSAEPMRTRSDENRTNVVAMTAQGQWSEHYAELARIDRGAGDQSP